MQNNTASATKEAALKESPIVVKNCKPHTQVSAA